MDQSQSPCPTPEQLVQYHLGNVPSQFAQWIVDHISTCPRCAGTLKGIRVANRAHQPATPAAPEPAPVPVPAAVPAAVAGRGLATLMPGTHHREVIRPELLDVELGDLGGAPPKAERETPTKVTLETHAEAAKAPETPTPPKVEEPPPPPQPAKNVKMQRATATIADIKSVNLEELMAAPPPQKAAPTPAPEAVPAAAQSKPEAAKPEPAKAEPTKAEPVKAEAKAELAERPAKAPPPDEPPQAATAAPAPQQAKAQPKSRKLSAPPLPADKAKEPEKAKPAPEAKPVAAQADAKKSAGDQPGEAKADKVDAKQAEKPADEPKAKPAGKRRSIDDIPTAVLMDGKRYDNPGDGDLSGSFDVESFWGLTAALEDPPKPVDLEAPKAHGDALEDEPSSSGESLSSSNLNIEVPPTEEAGVADKPAEPKKKSGKRIPTKDQAKVKSHEAKVETTQEETKPKVTFAAPPPAEMAAPTSGTTDPSNPWGLSQPVTRTLNPACQHLADVVIGVGVFTKEGFKEFLDTLPKLPQTPETLAHELVRARFLNGFQASLLLTGRHDELSLGEYIVVEMLSQSGQGILYSAIHQESRQPAAVKVFDLEAYTRSQCGAAAGLQHEHIARVLDCGQGDETGFVATEIVPGGDLAQVVRRERRLTLDRAVNYIIQAARGLAFAQEQGFAHGHIGPTNLLLAEGGKVKITDFGWAGLHPVPEMSAESYEEERSAASMGEMQREDLLAPEIFTGHKPDVQTDIYSLGATLAYLLVGVPMRLDKSLEKAAGTVPNIKEYVRTTPPAVQKVFRRMVAKDRAARYKTYAQLIDMLQATLDPLRHPEIEAVEAGWGKTASNVAASTMKTALNSQLLWVGVALAVVIGLAVIAFRS